MLKVYNVTDYISIDGKPWREIACGNIASDKELESQLILDNLSFDEVREYLQQHNLTGIWNDSTFFRKKPTIKIYCAYNMWDPIIYKNFNTLSYKREYKEWSNVSLDWIMKNLSADECIQYLKERGMTACPILK